MGGKNRAIEEAREDEERKKKEEVPQKSKLTTPQITALLHLHLAENVERARALRDQKRREATQLKEQYNNLYEHQLSPLYKENNKLFMEIFNLRAKSILEGRIIIAHEEKELKLEKEKIRLEKEKINKEFSISMKEANILKRVNKIFKKSTEDIDNIPLLDDRLVALEKLTRQETLLIEREIQLLKNDIKLIYERIEFNKKEKEFLEKEKTLINKTRELHKKHEEEKFSRENALAKEIEAIEKSILLHKEKKVQAVTKNNLTADALGKKLCVKDNKDDEIYIPARYSRKMKEPDDREMDAKVIEAIRNILYINCYSSSKSTGTKEMLEIINKMWISKSKNDKNPELVFHKLVECAEKRMGFFQSWYSQSNFFGDGRKDWVHKLYITLRHIKKNKGKFSRDEAVRMLNNIRADAEYQLEKNNQISHNNVR